MPSTDLNVIKDLAEKVYNQFITYSRIKASESFNSNVKRTQHEKAIGALDAFKKALVDKLNAVEVKPSLDKVNSVILSFYTILKKAAKTTKKKENLSFPQAFNDELDVHGDLIKEYFPENYAEFLKNKIQNAFDYYSANSQINCTFSFFHRHGEDGLERANAFCQHIKSLTNAVDIKQEVANYLKSTIGNTYPHSFKTILLASCSPDVYFGKAQREFPRSDALQEKLKEFSKTFEEKRNKLFSPSKKITTDWEEFIVFSPHVSLF